MVNATVMEIAAGALWVAGTDADVIVGMFADQNGYKRGAMNAGGNRL